MPQHVRLTYFDFPGRAGPIRYAFIFGGVEFEDHRISFEEWGATSGDRALYPQGTLPVLSVDGKTLSDSAGIIHYAAARAGLLPSDPFELAQVEEIGSTVEQIYSGRFAAANFASTMEIQDLEEKKRARSGPFTDTVRYYLQVLENIVKGNATGVAVGSKTTIADFVIHGLLNHLLSKDIDFFDDSFIEKEFPTLVAIRNKIKATPVIAAYDASGKGWPVA